MYITHLIILILSPEITLKNDFGIKGLIHYNQNKSIIFRKKTPIDYLHFSSQIIWILTIVIIIDYCNNVLNVFRIAPLGRAMTFTQSVITW